MAAPEQSMAQVGCGWVLRKGRGVKDVVIDTSLHTQHSSLTHSPCFPSAY